MENVGEDKEHGRTERFAARALVFCQGWRRFWDWVWEVEGPERYLPGAFVRCESRTKEKWMNERTLSNQSDIGDFVEKSLRSCCWISRAVHD